MSKVSQIIADLQKIQTGYGLMSLTWRPDPIPQETTFESMKRVVDLALERNTKAFFNVGKFYGPNTINLKFVREFFESYPELRQHIIVSCKGGMEVTKRTPKGKYDDVIASVESCLKEIDEYIDIFEVARLDLSLLKDGEVYPRESFQALADKAEEGRIGAISLSEVTAEQIKAIVADWGKYLVFAEAELSLFTPDILTNGVAKACNDLGLIIICYSPLRRDLLTGQITPSSKLNPKDFKNMLKRFQNDSLVKNQVCIDFLTSVIEKRPVDRRISLVQLAMGWIKHWNTVDGFKNTCFISIPSGSAVDKVNENFDESKCKITNKEFAKINELMKELEVAGGIHEFVALQT